MTQLKTGHRQQTPWAGIVTGARRLAVKARSMRPFGISQSESIMRFAPLGALTCLCGSRHSTETDADRREVCRNCGGLAVACSGERLDWIPSPAENRALIESLRLAGVRARGLEIPATVRSLMELHRYLDEYRGKKGRKPPRRPNAPIAYSRATPRQKTSGVA